MASTPISIKSCKDCFAAHVTQEGDEAKVYRAIGGQRLRNLDPFVLFDNTDTTEGQYPDHPHRGFDSVGYVLKGRLLHEDCMGERGAIDEGDLAWMTSGRGIVHAEKLDAPHVEVVTAWVNLKSSLKFCDPQYQYTPMASLTKAEDCGAGVGARILAGTALGKTAPTLTRTPTSFVDFQLQEGSELLHPISPGWNSFLYVLSGNVRLSGRSIGPKQVAVFSLDGEVIQLVAESAARVLVLAGEPVGQPCVQYGPFVMNSRAQILQAYEDFQHGRNGFERAPHWQSSLFHR